MPDINKIAQYTRIITGNFIKFFKAIIGFYKFSRNILSSKTAKKIFIAFSILLFFAYAVPLFLNNSGLKLKIEQNLSEVTGGSVIIKGPVEISLVPYPTISAKNIAISNISYDNKKYRAHLQQALSKIPLFGFTKNNISKSLTLKNIVIESSKNGKFSSQYDNIFNFTEKKDAKTIAKGITSKLFSIGNIKPDKTTLGAIPEIILQDCKFISHNKLFQIKEFEEINGTIAQNNNNISINIDFKSNNITSKATSVIYKKEGAQKLSFAEILSPIAVLRIEGQIENNSSNILENNFNGKIITDISDLKSFYGSYINNYDLAYNKLNHNSRPVKISANIEYNNQEVAINDIILNSDLIKGSGEANINLQALRPIYDFIFDIKNLDLDLKLSSEAANHETLKEAILPNHDKNSTNEKSNPQNKIDLTAEIKIAQLNYLDSEIKDVDIYLSAESKQNIMILPLIFKTPGGGFFRIRGSIDNGNKIPKFVGRFDAKGGNLSDIIKWFNIQSQNLKINKFADYLIYSDILLSPKNFTFNNIYLNLNNNESEFLGRISINKTASGENNIITKFSATDFNVDKYFLTSGQNIYLSPGSLLKKTLWLNNISYNNDIYLQFDRLIYNAEKFNDQKIGFKIGRGTFEVYDFDVKSSKNNLRANLSINIKGKTPIFNVRALADKFFYSSSNNNEPRKECEENLSDNNKANRGFADQLFALPSLKGFNGIINLTLKDIIIDNLSFKDTKIYSEIYNGTLKDAKINSKIFGGDIEFNGFIQAGIVKSINGNLEGKNINIKDVAQKLINYNNIEGIANINAGLSSSAITKEDFIKKLSSKIVFTAKPISIKEYGLNDLVKKMFAATINNKTISNPEAIIFNNDASTIFEQATGTIQISNSSDARFKASVKAPAINSVLSGSFSIKDKLARGLFNSLFLTGNREKQIPINIASNIVFKDNKFQHITNLDQVRQYLGLPTKYSYNDKNTQSKEDYNDIDFTKDFEDQSITQQPNP